ncbi:MAG: hypothetical protein JXJ22_09035 [Bacteroidales bacterium]|nr:hypothetical protein [Bacteroidales bacterium]
MGKNIVFLCLILFTGSCSRNSFDVDISGINLKLEIKRFDHELFSTPLDSLDEKIPYLRNEYKDFLPLFNYKIINIGSSENPGYADLLKSFVTDYSIYNIYTRTSEVFPRLDNLQKELETAFRYYLYYFPEKTVPEIVTYISGFNQSVVTAENMVGISLDKYLGENEELYNRVNPPFPQYMRAQMRSEKIVPDCMRAWGSTEFEFGNPSNNLINNMIYEGKIMYFVKAMMPFAPDTLLWGFSSQQLKFCEANEEQMWTYLVENKLLFNAEKFTVSKYIIDGPFTKDFGQNSPARAAVWLGYHIVSSYAKYNNLQFQEVLHETNYQKMLNLSKYNP